MGARQFSENLLPVEASKWTLQNATLVNGQLTLQAGGSASITFTQLNGTNLLPEVIRVSAKAQTYPNKYKPSAFINVHVVYIDNNTCDILIPVIDRGGARGIEADLTPNISNFDIDVSAYTSITYEVRSSAPVVLTEFTLQKSLSDVLKEDTPYFGIQISTKDGFTVKKSDGSSEAVFNSDTFTMRAKDSKGVMQDCIYFDAVKRKYVITGDVTITATDELGEQFSKLENTVDGFTITGPGGTTLIKGNSIETGSLDLTGHISFSDFEAPLQQEFNDIDTNAANAFLSSNTALGDVLALAQGNYTKAGTSFINGRFIYSPTLLGDTIGLRSQNGAEAAVLTMWAEQTWALDITSSASLRFRSAPGYNVFVSNGQAQNSGIHAWVQLLSDGSLTLNGNPLRVGAASYGQALPSRPTYDGQLYFLFAN